MSLLNHPTALLKRISCTAGSSQLVVAPPPKPGISIYPSLIGYQSGWDNVLYGNIPDRLRMKSLFMGFAQDAIA
jgi:hypothetical protein